MHDFRDHCYRQSVPMLPLGMILFGNIKKPLFYYNQKQNKVLYVLPAPKCTQPRFRARDLHGLYT